jgi:hypothetical protein
MDIECICCLDIVEDEDSDMCNRCAADGCTEDEENC